TPRSGRDNEPCHVVRRGYAAKRHEYCCAENLIFFHVRVSHPLKDQKTILKRRDRALLATLRSEPKGLIGVLRQNAVALHFIGYTIKQRIDTLLIRNIGALKAHPGPVCR